MRTPTELELKQVAALERRAVKARADLAFADRLERDSASSAAGLRAVANEELRACWSEFDRLISLRFATR